MFDDIWNTTVGGWYVYQWWLSIFIYVVTVRHFSKTLPYHSELNKKVFALRDHLEKYIGTVDDRCDIYLEGKRTLFEDINVLSGDSTCVGYWFIQSKTARISEDWKKRWVQVTAIREVFKNFYNNEHYSPSGHCCFVIASNTILNKTTTELIEKNSSDLKIKVLELLFSKKKKRLCSGRDVNRFIWAIEKKDRGLMEKLKWKGVNQTADEILCAYERLSDILSKTYIFDGISPKHMKDFLMLSKRSMFSDDEFLKKAFYKATHQSVRQGRLNRKEATTEDWFLYKKYDALKTQFWGQISKDIIQGGFLLL